MAHEESPGVRGVRPSYRWLGLCVAAIPWMLALQALGVNPFIDPAWMAMGVATFGFVFLARGEMRRAAALNHEEAAPACFFKYDLWSLGAVCIFAGLLVSSAASPARGLALRVSLREIAALLLTLWIAARRVRGAELRWIVRCLFVSAALQGLLALLQDARPEWARAIVPLTPVGLGARAAMIGSIGNPEYMAAWLAVIAAAGIVVATRESGKAGGRSSQNVLAMGSAALALLVIFISGGRGAFLALAGGLAAWRVILKKKSRRISEPEERKEAQPGAAVPQKKRALGVMLGVAVFLIIVVGVVLVASPEARRLSLPVRLGEMFDPHSPSVRHRLGIMAISAHMIGEHPVLGAGPGRYGAAFGDTLERLVSQETGVGYWEFARLLTGDYVGEAHCDPLQWWAEYGLLPVAGLFLMLGCALGAAPMIVDPEGEAIWTALVAVSLNMWVAFPLHNPARAILFWVLLGLVASLRLAEHEKRAT